MSQSTLRIENITGQASQDTACGVFNKKITVSNGEQGTLVAAVLIKKGQNVDIQNLLKDIFELSSKRLEDAQDQVLQAVESARDACLSQILQRQSLETETVEESEKPQVSFALLFFYKEVCYIVKYDQSIKIFVFDPPKSLELDFESGSGPLKIGQIYLISTEKFLSVFDGSVFSNEAQELDIEEIIDGLATEISAHKDQAEIGAAFILVKEEETREAEKIESSKTKELFDENEDNSKEQLINEPQELQEPQETKSLKKIPHFKNPLPLVIQFLGKLAREAKSLKRGDIGTVFRLRRNLVVLAIIVLLILAASALFTISQKSQSHKLAQFNTHFSLASLKYNEAQALFELNKSRAREILIEADREIKLAQELIKSEKSQKLAEDIANALKGTEVTENISFESLVQLDEEIGSLSLTPQNLIAFTSGKIFQIKPVDNSKDQINVPLKAISGFVYDNKGFILTDDKVVRVSLADKKSGEILNHQGASDISVFIGNIYLLTPDQVVKFSPIESGYANGVDYFSEKTSLSGTSRLAIDGNVWITNGQKILKFLRGENQNFEISGLTASIGVFGAIYTSANLDNIYVVDSSNAALLVIGKDGIYKKAYQSAEFGRAADLVISDGEDKIYLAVGNKILEAPLE